MGTNKLKKNVSRRQFLGSSALTGTLGVAALSLPLSQKTQANSSAFSSLAPLRPGPEIESLGTVTTLPPLAAMVLNKASFGPRPGDVDAFNALGANDTARLTTWVDDQLSPTTADPEVDSRMAAFLGNGSAYDTINKSRTQLWTEHHKVSGSGTFATKIRPLRQMERLFVLRATYSKWQLREVLNDFWFNHFNVKGTKDAVRSMLPNYDSEIRSRIFGNFFDMLLANSRTASMLYYLDNRLNTWPFPNENYAREVLELHTLGAIENYFGADDPSSVGTNIKGQRAGYVENDVFQFARALTGWSIANGFSGDTIDDGGFLFRANQHYDEHAMESIKVLDVELTVNGNENDVIDILQYLADHYGTARFIAWKLCTRLVGDNPPESLVASTADQFYNRRADNDQLKGVYRHILMSNEFQTTWGAKVKRPLETIISAMRATDMDIDFRTNHLPSDALFINYLSLTGQKPYDNDTPTGFPDDKSSWISSGVLVPSWRAITYFLDLSATTYNDPDTGVMGGLRYMNIAEQANAEIPDSTNRTPTQLVDMWINRLRGYSYDAGVKTSLISYVMNKSGLSATQAFADNDSNNTSRTSTYQRINYTLVGLILMTPDAMRR